MPNATPTTVYVEAGNTRVFACAVEWPGWCRSARNEENALQALIAYGPRYAPVAERAGLALPIPVVTTVVERLQGTATTDHGAPDRVPSCDARPLSARARERAIALMHATWAAFDATVARTPPELRRGPRGGGRDRDRMVEHVLGAERAYAGKIGVRHPAPALGDAAAIRSLRDAITERCRGRPEAGAAWPVAYFVRRLTWHALDHLWEMEDRA